MSPDFGHGFLPRIGPENHLAIDRCVGPASLWHDALDLPWAVVDAAWAERRPDELNGLRAHGARLLADCAGWRYRFASTLEREKHATASWAPTTPIDPLDPSTVSSFVRRSLYSQAQIGVDAYLAPGFVPTSRDEDLRPAIHHVVTTLESFTDIPAKPFVLTVGAHALALDRVRPIIDELPAWIEACYLLITPTDLRAVSATRLETLMDLYRHTESRGFQVVVARGGTIITALRAVGISAGDAGLATGETFDQSPARRGQKPSSSDEARRSGGPRSRMYLRQIDRSVDASEARRLLAVRGVAEELMTCRLPCHRFQAGDLLAHAREHSLWTRVDEARRISGVPEAGRIEALRDDLRQRRSTLTRINDALRAANEEPLDTAPLDNKLTWLNRAAAHSQAA